MVFLVFIGSLLLVDWFSIGFRLGDQDARPRILVSGLRIQDSELRVLTSGLRIQDSGLRIRESRLPGAGPEPETLRFPIEI